MTMDDDLQISGIQHFNFCRRQWALIHIEQEWADNYFTIDGNILHERVDDPKFTEKRGNIIESRALPVRSEKYGLSGRCDMVEFHLSEDGVPIAARDGLWQPVPIEYKRGSSKEIDADRLQLCAQAICLEEMLCADIPLGYIYYCETRHRERVELDAELREKTVKTISEMRQLYDRGYTPRVKYSEKCRSCSMKEKCLPRLLKTKAASDYNRELWERAED